MTTTNEKSLNRRVAEALGWNVIIGITKEHWYYADLFRPNGSWHNRYKEPDYSDYEAAAWANAGNYEHDLNTCARDLTVEGWLFHLKEWVEVGKPNSWLAEYYNNRYARGIGHWAETPAVAWCEAFLALQEYVNKKSIEETRT